MITCLIDQTQHGSRKDLHAHLRTLKVKQETYYLQFESRTCRGSGKPIPFKDWEQYLATDFIDKNALKAWMKANPIEGRAYAYELIRRRVKEKGITWVPSEVELKSLGLPRVKYYQADGRYNEDAAKLGLKPRFDYGVRPIVDLTERTIIQDTREQKGLKFDGTVEDKLVYADYALKDNPLVAVERKSLSDLIGTCLAGYDRFEREIQRAEEVGGYIVVLCESPLDQALSFDYLPHIKRHTKVKPQVVFHNIRQLIQRYEMVQFAFCDGREHMEKTIRAVLNWGDKVRRYDLQHLIGEGVL